MPGSRPVVGTVHVTDSAPGLHVAHVAVRVVTVPISSTNVTTMLATPDASSDAVPVTLPVTSVEPDTREVAPWVSGRPTRNETDAGALALPPGSVEVAVTVWLPSGRVIWIDQLVLLLTTV